MELSGTIQIAGDKSISHRLLMFAALIKGDSIIRNISLCKDVNSTIEVLRQCNIDIQINNKTAKISGGTLKSPKEPLNLGNSGTTARLMIGLLAGQNIKAKLIGDKSLSQRPMKRVLDPLAKGGAIIKSKNNFLPIEIISGINKPILYTQKTKSAQVKASLVFAGLGLNKISEIHYNQSTRDHSENFLKYVGISIKHNDFLRVSSSYTYEPFNIEVLGDFSNASFIIALAILVPGSCVKIKKLLYNEHRIGFLNVIKKMGADIVVENIDESCGEASCDLVVRYSPHLKNILINEDTIITMIDEIPLLSVLGSSSEGELVIDNASELRLKESDRIKAICFNLKNMGADIKETKCGFILKGKKTLYNTIINDFGDHRIAMAFYILNFSINNAFSNHDLNISKISFPEFHPLIKELSC